MGRLAPGQPRMVVRPIRKWHPTISNAGLVDGGSTLTPGEISLTHNDMPIWSRVDDPVHGPGSRTSCVAENRRVAVQHE